MNDTSHTAIVVVIPLRTDASRNGLERTDINAGDVSSAQYDAPMCRSKAHGTGRRCPGCGSYGAAAKANANRRLGREARKKVVDHLKEQGMVETAAAIQAAPPSVLQEFMEGLGIDPEILGKTPMPSTHSNPPSAKLLIAQAIAEREKLAGPKVTPAQAALDTAEENAAKADAEAEESTKTAKRLRSRLTTAKRKLKEGTGTEEAVAEKQKDFDEAKAAAFDAQRRQAEAHDDLAAAKFGMREDMADEDRDAYYASLSDDDVAAISRSLNRKYEDEATEALAEGPIVSPAGIERDTSVYKSGKIPMETGSGVEEVEGRYLDGGTAIVRRGSGDFVVLQRKGDAYHPVAVANGKHDALAKANRIPILVEPGSLPADATEMQKQAHSIKGDLLLDVARQAAAGKAPTADSQRKLINEGLAGANEKLTDSVGGGPARADIYDGTKRHQKRMRELAAVQAGEKARADALAAGKTPAQADQAYERAHRRALGTPTRGGGVIPHFEHKIPPESLGADGHASLYRSGIRAFGKETADDYAVIHQRAGDLKAWGFSTNGQIVKTTNLETLTSTNSAFVNKVLSKSERSALTTYTGGSYHSINAAITGRDPNPAASTKTVVSGIESAFDKFNEHNPNNEPMTVMRGTRVPSGWKGTAAEYIDQAFTVGSKMQIGKVTSTTTKQSTAQNFTGHPPYMMVIRTRNGLPVKSISMYKSEDEVIIPTGTDLRCVKVDHKGINGVPTVWLVAEDLVAEADGSPSPLKSVA
ncbi:ADP-ribosyltransferase [Prescottella equi]|uniref:ADP-ribosyltransferase n=1 Tax=Rhodococcus hoagii TaxID=43767 RepID=UPI00384E5E85